MQVFHLSSLEKLFCLLLSEKVPSDNNSLTFLPLTQHITLPPPIFSFFPHVAMELVPLILPLLQRSYALLPLQEISSFNYLLSLISLTSPSPASFKYSQICSSKSKTNIKTRLYVLWQSNYKKQPQFFTLTSALCKETLQFLFSRGKSLSLPLNLG